MSNTVDVDAYFARIGYDGPREPTLETLSRLHGLHPQAIAFENLSPLLGESVSLDLGTLQEKLVQGARGGYCFEQNSLFKALLQALGFQVVGLAARVVWNQPEDAVTPRTHMLLKVQLPEGPYLADVGFGGQVLTGPLRFDSTVAQATPHEPFRLGTTGNGMQLQSLVRGEWKTLYRFGLDEQFPIDYELSNYYVSTHPNSIFRQRLMVARVLGNLRHNLVNDQLTTHQVDARTGSSTQSEHRHLESVAELRAVLTDVFGLNVPRGSDADLALGRVLTAPARMS
ncbi:MAG TPA: arylamine N-acetyltransferase [Polyangiaceae bacterium]|nr:arylamine N-acetyltransferase [Polyangiaceae bacterium]